MRVSRSVPVMLLCAAVATHAAGLVKPRNLAKANQGVCAVAVGPDGAPHVVYQSPDYRLYHACLVGTKWQHEPVDTSSDCGAGNSLAVDSAGRVHVTYGAGTRGLAYAIRGPTGWQVTNVGVAGEQTHLQLDGSGAPHVLFISGSTQKYARYEAKGWHVEDTGLPWGWYSAGLALDGAGKAHISYAANSLGCYYATNASGAWQATQLVDGNPGHTAIALDQDGHPHVAVSLGSAVRYFSLLGPDWTWTEPWNATGLNILMDGVALAMGPSDRPRMLLAGSVAGTVEVAIYALDNGLGSTAVLIDSKNAGFYPSLALGPGGIAHGTYCTAGEGTVTARYVGIVLPDLAGKWASTGFAGGTSTFTGTLRITNPGQVKSPKTTVGFFLSDDALFDATADAVLDPTLKVKGLKPGATLDLAVRLTDARLAAGKYLIAVVDPVMFTGDTDAVNNVAAARLE